MIPINPASCAPTRSERITMIGGTPTTLHLHFEIKLNTAANGWQYAPPYASLLDAYKRRENNPGAQVADDFLVASTPR